LNSRNQRRTRR